MSKGFISSFLRVASFAVNFIPGIGQLASAAIIIGLNVGAALLTPRSKQQARQASATSMQLGEVPRQALFGRAATAGSLLNCFNYGGKYGTDWEVLVLALADHECDALEGLYVNDTYVEFAGDGVVSGFGGQLEVYWRPGTEDQSIPAVLMTHGDYASSDNAAGVSYVTVAYKSDASDAKNPVWPSGRPRFLCVLRGAKCYDPRKDSTVPGGSGPHRREDSSTWEWSENTQVCRYSFVRGLYACNRVGDPDMLLVGRGLSAVEAPPENLFSRANLCDEPVALTAGGTEPRYRVGGVVAADEEYGRVDEHFAAACGGVIVQPQGCVEIEPGQAKAPTFFFTDADLIVGSEVRWNDYRGEADEEWVNTVIPRYVEPTQRWSDHAAPIRRDVGTVIEDGGPREETLSLSLVTSGTQAGRCGEIRRRLGRLQGTGSVTLGPRFGEIEEGDWGVWISARRFGGEGRTVRVEVWSSPENGHMQLQLRQISASCFSDGADFDDGSIAAPQDPPPDIGAPAPGSWTLEPALLGNLLPGIAFEGIVDDRFARFVRFEYCRDDGVTDPEDITAWIGRGTFGPDVNRVEVQGLGPDEAYYGAVSYVVDNIPGDRLILGPVTTPENPLLQLAEDFNAGNNRNPAALTAPTVASDGSAIVHANNVNGSADVAFKWSFGGSEADIDGFHFLSRSSTSTSAYTPGTTPGEEDVLPVPADKRAVIGRGWNPTYWHTLAVRTYRVVDADVWAAWAAANPALAAQSVTGMIVSAWVKSTASGENPFRPVSSVSVTADLIGSIEGMATTTVVEGSTRANGAINSDFTVKNGKVLTASIAADAINNAAYGKLLATVVLSASDIYTQTLFSTTFDVQGGELNVTVICPINLEVVNPATNALFSATFRVVIKDTATMTPIASDDVILDERWTGTGATGSFSLASRIVNFDCHYSGLAAGTYQVGLEVETPASNGAYLPGPRLIQGEDLRAIK